MVSNLIVLLVAVLAAAVLFSRKLQTSATWQATVTPLASIIGSGFLVSVPLLAGEVGNWSVIAMTALVGAAYLIGVAIRFNIRHAEPLFAGSSGSRISRLLEELSHLVLAIAYFISVTYYLVLLSNFLLNVFGIANEILADSITTAILAALGGLGLFKGLGMVQRIEKYTVGINLAIIAALLGGLLWYNGHSLVQGSWHLGTGDNHFNLHSVRVLLGLIIVVQGFETSRFLGSQYDAITRIRTMRYAQWIATAVYIPFFLLMTALFPLQGDETGIADIIGLVGNVALVLPVMLTIGAIASQFSASVADSIGSAGLIETLSGKRISMRHAYPVIALSAIIITWSTDVFRIITLASQAFAIFYLVQSAVAFSVAFEKRDLANRTGLMCLFAGAAVFCLCVVLFGIPSGN